jgi:CRISPR-associated protein Cmr1
LVAPLFGGGVTAGEVDKAMPVRGAAIRGQLRFWWRVACSQIGEGSRELFRRETDLWGGIADAGPTASKVRVRVNAAPVDDGALMPSDADQDAGVRYAFGPSATNGVAQWLKPGYGFQVTLTFPESARHEVDLAIRWWASFGGLGARTRRGFGAFFAEGIEPIRQPDIEARGGVLRLRGQGSPDAGRQWKSAVQTLFDFRQGRGIGRRQGGARPGQSFWPEADQIRRFTGKNAHGRHIPVHDAGNVFPRAAFGLPIIFEFRGSPGDPDKIELLPDAGGNDRLASPLILRPYWNGSAWQPAALLLPGWEQALIRPLKFKGRDYTPQSWPGSDQAAERERLAQLIKPMQGRGGDILTAFLDFFEKGGR